MTNDNARAPTGVSRRAVLGGLGGLGLASALSIDAGRADGSGLFPAADDRDGWLAAWLRVQASLEEKDSPWWYMGRIYAQVGEATPNHILDLEGTEIYWPRSLGNGEYSISSRTLTFFKDPASGEMLEEFTNPYSGETLPVRPNILGGPDGARYTREGMIFASHIDPSNELRRWNWDWKASGPHVWLMASRAMTRAPQPWLEAMTMFCRKEEFADAGNRQPSQQLLVHLFLALAPLDGHAGPAGPSHLAFVRLQAGVRSMRRPKRTASAPAACFPAN